MKIHISIVLFVLLMSIRLFAANTIPIVPNEGIGNYQLNISYTTLEDLVGKPDEMIKVKDDIALLIYTKDNIQVLLQLAKSQDEELITQTIAIRTENPNHVFGKDHLRVGDTLKKLISSMGKPDRILRDGSLVQYVYNKQYVLTVNNNKVTGVIVWYTANTASNPQGENI